MSLSQLVSYGFLTAVLAVLAYGFTARSTETRPGVPAFARAIDAYNERVSRTIAWFLVATILVSAGNAISRYALNMASNAWLELQWNLFAAAFLFGASWTLKTNEHVRIDIVSSNLPQSARNWIDVFGHIVFLLPFCLIHIYYGIDYFMRSYEAGETSTHAGGLIFWPAKLILLIGFVLLTLQALSELVKRFAIIAGRMPAEDGGASAAEREVRELLDHVAPASKP